MKSLNQIQSDLKTLEPKLGFDPNTVNQGTEEWLTMRLGVITASCADKVLAKKGTATRNTYMLELISEVCTGNSPEVYGAPLEWGKDNEAGARACYEFQTDLKISEVPFIYKDTSLRAGCSPDGLLQDRGAEIKCPYTTKYHVEFVIDSKIKPEYMKQVQFSMWVTGAKSWDFCSYDPRMKVRPFHFVSVERDEKLMTDFDERVPEFVEEMDQKLKKIGLEFGAQWTRSRKFEVA
jgi:putative phage-type endonuclease